MNYNSVEFVLNFRLLIIVKLSRLAVKACKSWLAQHRWLFATMEKSKAIRLNRLNHNHSKIVCHWMICQRLLVTFQCRWFKMCIDNTEMLISHNLAVELYSRISRYERKCFWNSVEQILNGGKFTNLNKRKIRTIDAVHCLRFNNITHKIFVVFVFETYNLAWVMCECGFFLNFIIIFLSPSDQTKQ